MFLIQLLINKCYYIFIVDYYIKKYYIPERIKLCFWFKNLVYIFYYPKIIALFKKINTYVMIVVFS